VENTTTQTEQATSTESASTEATETATTSTEQEIATSFANGKYKTISDLENGYDNLQKKLGSFVGAPDEYSITEGTEHNSEHPILAQIQSFGKENNLSNEGYNNLVNVLLESEKANEAEYQTQVEQVKKDLGPNANERIQNVTDFVNANMELDDNMKGLIETAKETQGGVELLEAFIGMSKKTGPASEQVVAPIKTYNKDTLNQMQFAKDDYGNRKMNDPDYRKQVEDYHANLLAQG